MPELETICQDVFRGFLCNWGFGLEIVYILGARQ